MNAIAPTLLRRKGALGLGVCATVLLLLGSCHGADSGASGSQKDEAGAEEGADEGLTLKPEEIRRMGIVTTDAQAITSEPEAVGFAVVIAHETVATALAEIRTALAAERQSRSALERSRRLAGTPGAMPADTQETAERQAITDRAVLELARQRLSSTFGQSPPWKTDDNSPELLALASGKAKLTRVTFPLGSIDNTTPKSLRLGHLDNTSPDAKSWHCRRSSRAPWIC
jgi:hypothetical protein